MWLVVLVLVGCGQLLLADAVPGYLGVGPCCWVIGLTAVVGLHQFTGWLGSPPGVADTRSRWPSRRRRTAAALVAGGTLGLTLAEVPRRLGLWWSRAEFEALLAAAPHEHRGTPLGRRVGLYQIDRYASDAEGGVFFRTADGPDGIGPDTMSYGFAYRPHHASCPFGHARYRVRHLFGDWYSFAVSDDS